MSERWNERKARAAGVADVDEKLYKRINCGLYLREAAFRGIDTWIVDEPHEALHGPLGKIFYPSFGRTE